MLGLLSERAHPAGLLGGAQRPAECLIGVPGAVMMQGQMRRPRSRCQIGAGLEHRDVLAMDIQKVERLDNRSDNLGHQWVVEPDLPSVSDEESGAGRLVEGGSDRPSAQPPCFSHPLEDIGMERASTDGQQLQQAAGRRRQPMPGRKQHLL